MKRMYIIGVLGFILLSCHSKDKQRTIDCEILCSSSEVLTVKDMLKEEFDSLYLFYPNVKMTTALWEDLDEWSSYFNVDIKKLYSNHISKDYTVLVFIKDSKVVAQIDVPKEDVLFYDKNFSEYDSYIAGYHNKIFHLVNSKIHFENENGNCKAYVE